MKDRTQSLSPFGEVAEQAFRERDVFVGQPVRRRELISSIEAQGMTADEFRLVMRWWSRQTGFVTPGVLLDVLAKEVNWRDVVACERPRREREEPIDTSHYPGMPEQRYETNPIIRELGRRPPFTDRDAVDAYQAGLGLNLWYLAFHLGWSDDAERHEATLNETEPPGVTRLRDALRAAGIETEPWRARAPKPQETPAQRRQRTEQDERHARVQAWMRIRTGRARDGDHQLVEGWEVPEALQG